MLIDECVPKKFKFSLIAFEHECLTVPEAGFAGKQNGELLTLAETRFDVFLTLDKGFEYQQTLAGRKLSIIIIRAKSNRFAVLVLTSSGIDFVTKFGLICAYPP